MSTWHPVAVNITTNQSDSMFKVRPQSSWKKICVQVRESNQQSRGEWIRKKETLITTKPNWHYWLCVVAHYVPTWIPEPIHRHNMWAKDIDAVNGKHWLLYCSVPAYNFHNRSYQQEGGKDMLMNIIRFPQCTPFFSVGNTPSWRHWG
jgi:hypothetical protein